MTSTRHDDMPRDAWLGEALQHAPDTEARPPAALRSAILRAATAQVGAEAPQRRPGLLSQAWSALGRPRTAGAFASLMVMLFAGVLWWDRPLVDALPQRKLVAAAMPPASSASPPGVAGPQRQSDQGRLGFDTASSSSRRSMKSSAGSAASAATPPVDVRRLPRLPKLPAIEAPSQPQLSKPLPATATPGRRAPPASPVFDATRSTAAAAPHPALADIDAERRSDALTEHLAPSPLARTESKAMSERIRERQPPLPLALVLARLRVAVVDAPGWGWQRDAGDLRPANEALGQWLDRLASLASPEGAAGNASAPVASPDAATLPTLRLWRAGRSLHTFRIESDGVSWRRSEGAEGGAAADGATGEAVVTRHIPLTLDQRLALIESLNRLGP